MSIALPLVHILMMKQDTFRRFFCFFNILHKKNERIFSNENNKKSLYGVLIEILSCDEEKNFLATSEDQRAVNILLQSDSRQRHECGNVMKDTKKMKILRWRWAMPFITRHHDRIDASANGFSFSVFCFKIRHNRVMHICKYYERIL